MAAIRPYLEETHREDPVEAPAENTQADTEAFSGRADPTKDAAFNVWFKRSKVVDGRGKPLVVYHGTSHAITAFENTDDIGFHFTADKDAAKTMGTKLVTAYLSIQNPLRVPDLHTWSPQDVVGTFLDKGILTRAEADELFAGPLFIDREWTAEVLARRGYDGLVYVNETEGGGDSWIAVRPEQIKSTRNQGTWSSASSNIFEGHDPCVAVEAAYSAGIRALQAGDKETARAKLREGRAWQKKAEAAGYDCENEQQLEEALRDGLVDGRFSDYGIIQGAPPLESSHAELTRTHFIRKTLEDALIDQRYWIERRQGAAEAPGLDGFGDAPVHYGMFALGAPSGPRKRPKAQTADDGRDKTGELVFKLSPGIPNDIVPWYIGAIPLVDTVSFFGSNGKMKCPTWDLPAGSPQIGGACPGALQAQTVVPPAERKKLLVADGKHWRLPVLPPGADEAPIVREAECICQLCYAMEGNYPSPHVQIGELVRYWWSRDLIAAAPERWIETMVEAVLALDIEEMNEIEPIRIHSSGDFFAPAYAEAWMEVANRVHAKRPKIRFWAPTRTWAAPKWLELWPRLLKANTAKNFIVRASAYQIGDVAPEALAPHRGRGSTTIFNGEILGMKKEFEAVIAEGRRAQYEANRAAAPGEKKDPRFDWDCQTYAVALEGRGDLSKSCADAIGPNGKRGCRACWTHPELRINYTTH